MTNQKSLPNQFAAVITPVSLGLCGNDPNEIYGAITNRPAWSCCVIGGDDAEFIDYEAQSIILGNAYTQPDLPRIAFPVGGLDVGTLLCASSIEEANLPAVPATEAWGIAAINGWLAVNTVGEMLSNIIEYRLLFPIVKNFTTIDRAARWASYTYGVRFEQRFWGRELPPEFDSEAVNGMTDGFFDEREKRFARHADKLAKYMQWRAEMAFGVAANCLPLQ